MLDVVSSESQGMSIETANYVQSVILLYTYIDGDTNKNNASRTLGLALHVAGDAYAHQVIVPDYDSVVNIVQANGYTMEELFRNPARVKERIEAKDLTTRQFKNLAFEEEEQTVRELTEDNPDYLPKRYNYAAKWACSRILRLWDDKKKFDPYVFCPKIKSDNCKQYRLNGLASHLNAVYPLAGLNGLDNLLDSEDTMGATGWYKLSGMK